MNKDYSKKFLAELVVQNDGKIKVKMAKQHIIYNQHRRTWKETNARDVARLLNRSVLIIK